jgi:hypothetical protein
MAGNNYGSLGYSLNRYFLRNGLISVPVLNGNGIIRLAERVSGKPSGQDKVGFLRDFAESHGIRPYTVRGKTNRRRQKPVSAPFYLSREWQSLRYRLIRESDGKCNACGATAKSSGRPMHVDHIIPRSVDPSRELDYSNLQLLCEACNLGKSNRDSKDWRGSAT